MKTLQQAVKGIAVMVAVVAGVPAAWAQTTGWSQTGAGPYDYSNTGNWVGGTVNGLWDSTLTLAAAQTVTFGASSVLGTGFTFNYAGAFNVTFQSDGTADRTITLGGDITVSPASNQTITFGSATANQNLNINLGGVVRTFTVASNKTLTFESNALSNGGVILSGPASGGGQVYFKGASAYSGATTVNTWALNLNTATAAIPNSDVTVDGGSSGGAPTTRTLAFSTGTAAGVTRVKSVTLGRGMLAVAGVSGNNTIDSITGALAIDGSSGLLSVVGVTPNSSRNARLSVGGLTRVNHGVVEFAGVNLGSNAIASATLNSGNIEIRGTAPVLAGGGGAAGTTTISIMPWAIGDVAVPANASANYPGSTFVTYTAANGIRPLLASEYAGVITDGGNSADNVRLTGGTNVTTATTMNSLILAGNIAVTGAKLTITSGAVLVDPGNVNTASLGNDLDFGTAEGVIGASYNRNTSVGGIVSGSGGVTLYNNTPGYAPNNVFTFGNAANTYTGPTVILGNITMGATSAFPSGTRTGDLYVYNTLRLQTGGGTTTINGLNGNGYIYYANSSAAALSLGDNNASGAYPGTLAQTGGGLFGLTKIGSGTQVLSGTNSTYQGVTSIQNGSLSVASINNTNAPLPSSSLGKPATTANGTIGLGSTTTAGQLTYAGPGETSDRVINLAGTTGGGTLDASGTGALVLSSALTATGAGSKTLTLQGASTAANTLQGAIVNNSAANKTSLTKAGAGKWILSGASTYTGPTTVTNGTLAINGGIASPVTVWSNAVLTGTGVIATNDLALTVNAYGIVDPGSVGGAGTLTVSGRVYFASGSLFRVDVNATTQDCLVVTGTVTAASSPVSVLVTADASQGPWLVMKAATIVPEFISTTPDYVFHKNTPLSTELWMYRGKRGTCLIIQ